MTSMDYRGRRRVDRRIAGKLSSVDTFSDRNIITAVELTGFIVRINCSGFPVDEGRAPGERNNYRYHAYLQRA